MYWSNYLFGHFSDKSRRSREFSEKAGKGVRCVLLLSQRLSALKVLNCAGSCQVVFSRDGGGGKEDLGVRDGASRTVWSMEERFARAGML